MGADGKAPRGRACPPFVLAAFVMSVVMGCFTLFSSSASLLSGAPPAGAGGGAVFALLLALAADRAGGRRGVSSAVSSLLRCLLRVSGRDGVSMVDHANPARNCRSTTSRPSAVWI